MCDEFNSDSSKSVNTNIRKLFLNMRGITIALILSKAVNVYCHLEKLSASFCNCIYFR